MALELAGYQVQAASGGEEAITLLLNDSHDLVILDLAMPQINGWDVFHFMRDHARLQHTPVLVLTAVADEQTRRQVMAERVNGLLVKPVSLDEILTAVERIV